jgi:hypothetical protein
VRRMLFDVAGFFACHAVVKFKNFNHQGH